MEKSGSPPRVREKPDNMEEEENILGITPASAGKTQIKLKVVLVGQDHPRECGKNALNHGFVDKIMGSPPRVREKPTVSYKNLLDGRITPASAGKTES